MYLEVAEKDSVEADCIVVTFSPAREARRRSR